MYAETGGFARVFRRGLARRRGAPYIRGMKNLKQGGGFGFVVLLITVTVVMLLAARALRGLGGTALDASRAGRPAAEAPELAKPDVNSGAGQRQIDTRAREAQRRTSEHSDEVRKALESAP